MTKEQSPQDAEKPAGGLSALNAGLARCWFMHKYTKWIDIANGPILKNDHKTPVGYYIRQERRCSVCGMVQVRDANAT